MKEGGRHQPTTVESCLTMALALILTLGPSSAFAQAPVQHVPTELRASQVCSESRPASGAAGSSSLTPPSGQFLYVNSIEINGASSAALGTFGTPASASTTNLPGTISAAVFPIQTQPAGVSIGNFYYPYAGNALKSLAPGTAVTVTTPAITGVLWHIAICGYFAP